MISMMCLDCQLVFKYQTQYSNSIFLLFSGAEIWVANVVLWLLGCPKWLPGHGYEVIMSLLIS